MQQKRKNNIEAQLLAYLRDKTFTGCVLSLSALEDGGFSRNYFPIGKCDKASNSNDVEIDSYFDLASLTKPLVTVLSLLVLMKEGKISLDERLTDVLPVNPEPEKQKIKISDLLHHVSGLPAHRAFYKERREQDKNLTMEYVIEKILAERLLHPPGEVYVYSDLDYILLGYIIEIISGESLASFWQRKICHPLSISHHFYCYDQHKPAAPASQFVSTGRCFWSKELMRGKVHDDNCRALGRLCGHAGLFATIEGVTMLAEEILTNLLGINSHTSYSNRDLINIVSAGNGSKRPGAFDIPTGDRPSCGKSFSSHTIGHLGFTGTSFWIDLERGVIAVLLTNRVIYGNDNAKIKAMRPAIHDTLFGV